MKFRTPLELGLLIRRVRRARGMTQADLVRAAGVGRQWIVAIEAGKPRAELGKAFQTLAVLDLSLSIHGDGIPEPPSPECGSPSPTSKRSLEPTRTPQLLRSPGNQEQPDNIGEHGKPGPPHHADDRAPVAAEAAIRAAKQRVKGRVEYSHCRDVGWGSRER